MKQLLRDNRKKIWKILKPLLLLGLLVGFFFYIPVKEIFAAVQSVDPGLFWGSFLVGFPALYLVAVQLWLLVRKQGISPFIHQIFVINMVVRFYSFFSPTSIIGSGLKWYKLSSGGKEAEALSAVVFSRAWDIFLAIFWGMLWVLLGVNSQFVHPVFFPVILSLLILGWFFIMRVSPVLGKWIQNKERLANHKIFQNLFSSMGKLFDAMIIYKNFSVIELLILCTASLSKEIISLMGHVLLARALHISISFVDLGWMRSIFFLSALAPFTMAGGIGLREVSIVLVMSAFGIDADLAVAYSFLLYARSLMLHLSGGVIELLSLIFSKVKE